MDILYVNSLFDLVLGLPGWFIVFVLYISTNLGYITVAGELVHVTEVTNTGQLVLITGKVSSLVIVASKEPISCIFFTPRIIE